MRLGIARIAGHANCHAIKNKNRYHSLNEWYINNLAKIKVMCVFYFRALFGSVSPKIPELRVETVCKKTKLNPAVLFCVILQDL